MSSCFGPDISLGVKHEVRYLLVESHAASPFPLVITDQVFHFATIELLKRVIDI